MSEREGEVQNEQQEAEERPLRDEIDYYIENVLMVFTAAFLEGRGYCCESGCRHCPYGYTKDSL